MNLTINRIADLLQCQIASRVAADLSNSLHTILVPMIIDQLDKQVDQALQDFEQEEVL